MLQGIDISDGMEFGLYVECNDQNIFGFVRYVQKDSDAESKGKKAEIKMTLTTPNCPVAESLPKEVKEGAMQG